MESNKYLLYIFLIYIVFIYNFLKLNKKIIILLGMVPFFLLLAFQINIGADYQSYVDIYIGKEVLSDSRGILFNILVNFFSSLTKNYRFFFIVVGIIESLLFYKILLKLNEIKKIENIQLFLFSIITTTNFYLMMFNGIRNAIAALFIVLSILFWLERKNIQTLFLFILGVGFHPSVIVTVVLFPLKNFLFKKKNTIFWGILFIFSYIFNRLDLVRKIAIYIYNLNIEFRYRGYLISKYMFPYSKTYAVGPLIQIFFYLLSLSQYKKLKNKNDIFLFNLGYMTFSLIVFFTDIPILARIVQAFVFFEAYVIYQLLVQTFSKKNIYLGIIIYIFYIVYFIRQIIV